MARVLSVFSPLLLRMGLFSLPRWLQPPSEAPAPPYRLPEPAAYSPTMGMNQDQVVYWLRQGASSSDIYSSLGRGQGYECLIAERAGPEQLSENVLWQIVGEVEPEEALVANRAFAGEHVALLMNRLGDDLRYFDEFQERFGRVPDVETHQANDRLKRFARFLGRREMPEMEGEHPALEQFMESLVRKKGSARGHRLELARVVLKQPKLALTDEQLVQLVRAFPEESSIARVAMARSRTGNVALALYEALDAGRHPLWANMVAQSEGALSDARVRKRALEVALLPAKLLVLTAELRYASAESYPVALQALWEHDPPVARQAFAATPPPPGTELPKRVLVEMLEQGSAEERLATIRSLGGMSVTYAASSPGEGGRAPVVSQTAEAATKPMSRRRR